MSFTYPRQIDVHAIHARMVVGFPGVHSRLPSTCQVNIAFFPDGDTASSRSFRAENLNCCRATTCPLPFDLGGIPRGKLLNFSGVRISADRTNDPQHAIAAGRCLEHVAGDLTAFPVF